MSKQINEKDIVKIFNENVNKTTNDMYPWYLLQQTEQDKQTCLTRRVCEEDKARGGAGVACVSCPCPRCSPRC